MHNRLAPVAGPPDAKGSQLPAAACKKRFTRHCCHIDNCTCLAPAVSTTCKCDARVRPRTKARHVYNHGGASIRWSTARKQTGRCGVRIDVEMQQQPTQHEIFSIRCDCHRHSPRRRAVGWRDSGRWRTHEQCAVLRGVLDTNCDITNAASGIGDVSTGGSKSRAVQGDACAASNGSTARHGFGQGEKRVVIEGKSDRGRRGGRGVNDL